MIYGLIGYPLKHSFSKEIHNLIGNKNYELFELNKNDFFKFIKNKNFDGINVTIPYKEEVINYIDSLDEYAKNIKSVNTIKNINNVLYGYNTDILGFDLLLKKFNVNIKKQNILIFGTGGTSNTVYYILKNNNYVNKVSRTISEYENIITYEDLLKNKNFINNTNIIINTTPNGMFPHIYDDLLTDLYKFKNLHTVIDVIYNPIRTKLLIKSNEMNKKSINGLYMLIAQAVFANEIFINNITDGIFDNQKLIFEIDEIYKNINSKLENIVLIGMPSCGKSTIAELLSKKYDYKYIDSDREIEKKIKMKICDYINKFGEEKFREEENKIIEDISKLNNAVISTGGGVVLNKKNIENLKMNGKIYYINKDLDKLIPTSDRPLTNTYESLKNRYYERNPLYKKYCDIDIDGNADLDTIIDNIYNKHTKYTIL